MQKLPYLKKNRHNVYYFRLIFTKSVRSIVDAPQEISLSLETKDLSIARDRYMILYSYARIFRWSLHELVLKGNVDVNMMKLRIKAWKEKNHLRELLAQKDNQLSEANKALLHANNDNKALVAHASQLNNSNQRLTGALDSAIIINDILTSSAIKLAVQDDALKAVSSDAPEREAIASTHAKKQRTERISKSQTLHAYVKKFLKHEEDNSTHTTSTKTARRINLMRFLDIVGYNVALASLTATHIRHYREMMHAIPINFEKQGFTIPKAYSKRPSWFKKTISEWDGPTLSGGGIETHLKNVRMFLRWAHREHYLEHDFVSMLKTSNKIAKATKKEVLNFMPEDLQKLFIDGYLYGDKKVARENSLVWQFWVPLIALYTGMRSEEIGSLRLSNIVTKEGFWCIQIGKSKTDAGIRTFPIPKGLLDAGLLEYHQQVLETHNGDTTASLFPALTKKGGSYSNRIGQFFNRNCNGTLADGTPRMMGYLVRCGVNNPSEMKTLKFHSFRHGFITNWIDARKPLNTLKSIIGHRGDFKAYGITYEEQQGATETYIHIDRVSGDDHKKQLLLMKQCMDDMDFGVDLSGISYERYLARV